MFEQEIAKAPIAFAAFAFFCLNPEFVSIRG
jgi:hypothetical protein